MIVKKEKLIARLGNKTGLEVEEVEDQVKELLKSIRQTTDGGSSFEIEGFGVFKKENDFLEFYPDRILETEINNKYAGMKPIELIGAFKEPETGEMPEMTAESDKQGEVWAFDKAEASAAAKASDAEEEQPADSSSKEEEPAGEPEEEAPTVSPAGGNDSLPTEPVSVDSSDVTGEVTDEKKEPLEGSEKPSSKEAEKDPIGRFVAVAVSLLLIGITGWLGYEFLSGDNTMNTERSLIKESQQERIPSQQVNQVQEDEQDADLEAHKLTAEQRANQMKEETSEPEPSSQVIKDEGSLSENAQNAPYGLLGTLNQSLGSWYTIVVHSLKSQDKATENKEQLEAEGFRVKVSQVLVNGSLQYRIGIGQFSTIEDALEAIGELPEPYKSNNFIKRF